MDAYGLFNNGEYVKIAYGYTDLGTTAFEIPGAICVI